jgi:Domain of unknown function (DUF4258)
MHVRFSRHAKNEMRLYEILSTDVESALANPSHAGVDDKGNLRIAGPDGGGRAIIVIVADDDPDFVITTFPDD